MNKLLLLFILFPFFSQGQTITTIAGTRICGYNGDGIPATAAQLYDPSNIAVGKDGSLYIADNLNNKIRKIEVSGIINTIDSVYSHVSAVGVDSADNIYSYDADWHHIYKIDGSGNRSIVAGNGLTTSAGDGGPATAASFDIIGMTVDPSGNIYIADYYGSRIRKINTAGIINTIAGTGIAGYSGDGGPATTAQIGRVGRIAVDGNNNLYISDGDNARIRMINTSGIISTVAGIGSPGYTGDGGPATNAKVSYPQQISVDHAGNLYFADDNVVRKISTAGIISTYAGNGISGESGDGGLAINAELQGPMGLAHDNAGNLLITDIYGCTVRKVTAGTSAAEILLHTDAVIEVYPVPAQDMLNLTSSVKINTVVILNVLGQQISSYNFDGQRKIVIKLDNVPSGFFTVIINNSIRRKCIKS